MSAKPPELPRQVSEIFGWADAFSDFVHKQARIGEIQRAIHKTRCGDCKKWMCRTCPREVQGKDGFQRGPDCEATICDQYIEKERATVRREELKQELTSLTI